MEIYEKTDSYAEFKKLKAQNDLMKIKKKKAPKDPNRPKRPLSAYMFFVQDYRNQHQNLKVTEVSKAAAAEWNKLGDSKRHKYVEKADVAKREYVKVQAEYEKSEGYTEFQQELEEFKKKKILMSRTISRSAVVVKE